MSGRQVFRQRPCYESINHSIEDTCIRRIKLANNRIWHAPVNVSSQPALRIKHTNAISRLSKGGQQGIDLSIYCSELPYIVFFSGVKHTSPSLKSIEFVDVYYRQAKQAVTWQWHS